MITYIRADVVISGGIKIHVPSFIIFHLACDQELSGFSDAKFSGVAWNQPQP